MSLVNDPVKLSAVKSVWAREIGVDSLRVVADESCCFYEKETGGETWIIVLRRLFGELDHNMQDVERSYLLAKELSVPIQSEEDHLNPLSYLWFHVVDGPRQLRCSPLQRTLCRISEIALNSTDTILMKSKEIGCSVDECFQEMFRGSIAITAMLKLRNVVYAEIHRGFIHMISFKGKELAVLPKTRRLRSRSG